MNTLNTLNRFTVRTTQVIALFGAVVLLNTAHAEDKPRIGLVMKSLANEFFQTMEQGARAHQKKSGKYELIANGTKNEGDTSGQIKIVEQMIVTQVDAIVIAPSDSKALIPVIKRAIDAGIVVVNIDNKLDEAALKEKRMTVPFVGPSDRAGAEKVSTYIAQQLKAGDKVAIIEGLPTANNAKQRSAGHQEAMKAAKMNVISIQSGEWEINKSNKISAALLNEHPDLKAILCGNDSMAIGAVAAVKAAGKTGKVLVSGFDHISAVWPMLKDGRLAATASQHADQLAVYGIENAMTYLKSKQAPKSLSGFVETPVDLIPGKK